MQAFDLDKNKNCFLYKRLQVRWSIRSLDFAEEGRFYRFQIFLEGGEGNERVWIYVNGGRDDQLLAISSYRRTSTNCRSLGTKRSTFKYHTVEHSIWPAVATGKAVWLFLMGFGQKMSVGTRMDWQNMRLRLKPRLRRLQQDPRRRSST